VSFVLPMAVGNRLSVFIRGWGAPRPEEYAPAALRPVLVS